MKPRTHFEKFWKKSKTLNMKNFTYFSINFFFHKPSLRIHNTTEMPKQYWILPLFNQNMRGNEKSSEKNGSKKNFFWPSRPIFYVVSKKVIFTTVTNIQYPENNLKVPSVSVLQQPSVPSVSTTGWRQQQLAPTCKFTTSEKKNK